MDTRENNIFYPLFLILTLAAALLVIILYILQMSSPSETMAAGHFSISVSDRVVRGSIYDSGYRLLAVEVPVYSVSLWTPEIRDPEAVAAAASKYLGMSKSDIMDRIARRQGFLYLARRVDYETAQALQKDIDDLRLRGITLEKHYGRLYPYQEMAAQTIGFTDIDNIGASGIEYYYENQLHPLPVPGREATYGNDLVLTLSVPFQVMLDNALKSIIADHDADGVSGVIMDGKTGDILAIGSYPSFDLNRVSESTESQRLNRAASSMYEPGSVFKVFSLAAIIEETGTDHEPFYCRGTHTLALGGGSSVTINCTSAHGEVHLEDIIKYSCNNAIAALAMKADDQRFYQTLLDFGFSRRTNTGLPGESPGLLSPPETWSARSKPTIAFGQESGMTALQIAAAATVFTNDGVLLQSHIIREILDSSGDPVYMRDINEIGRVISSELAGEMVSFMETAVERGGTANRMHTPGVLLAAKTGTAQLPDRETGGYSRSRYLASTLALMPGNDTTYIIYIAADYPKAGSIYGAAVVVPYIKTIVEQSMLSGFVNPIW